MLTIEMECDVKWKNGKPNVTLKDIDEAYQNLLNENRDPMSYTDPTKK